MESTALHFLILTVAGWMNRRQTDAIVTPETILRWYRRLIAKKYDGSPKRGPGRPRVDEEVRLLVIRASRDNPRWGYTRIVGAPRNVGLTLSRSTVKRMLDDEGILPAPERSKRTPWTTFGLERYHVFFVIEIATRRVYLAGVVHEPGGRWMMHIGRNLLDDVDGFLRDKRFLILDRDPLFTAPFRRLLKDAGVDVVRLPARSPNLNAYAERFVRSVRDDCLNHIIPLSEAHLRRTLREYLEHYHLERNHQGLDNELIQPRAGPANNGEVIRKRRLGGLSSFYERRAA